MNSQSRTVAVLNTIEAALAAVSTGPDQSLVAAARAFIPLAVEAERAAQGAMDDNTDATERVMHDAARRADEAALPLLNVRAQSLAGLIAKSAVSLWCNSADMLGAPIIRFDKVTDRTSAQSIVHDLLRMTDFGIEP